ncbi:hypothetical protein LTS03_007956 [Exophiala xenobiotica]|nr:hypothetical protein LTR92_000620 [Exophiala xenobiotica]KAK5246319.1 hypothetical protein LTS06_008341 [Exophiala xenobiotica]KAK5314389.1 hypothetical protein LTR93_010404 [Exophiala xenobiotica]KAK5354419.1 hypothetical protein LTR61_001719 [Exophiala xenobiotica]KAK5361547.1 hypothetical protein LTR11_009869 [Exophiala xenobiotica]
MAASIFALPFHFLRKLVPARTPSSDPHDASMPATDEAKAELSGYIEEDLNTTRDVQMSGRPANKASKSNKKRKAADYEIDEPAAKRVLTETGSSNMRHTEQEDDGSVVLSLGSTKVDVDRALMPPPQTPARRKSKIPQNPLIKSIAPAIRPTVHDEEDDLSFTSTSVAKRRTEDMDENVMEERRKYIASSWMLDFGTLPISVFAHENTADPPLVHNVRDKEFRAARALRELFEAGHDTRDRVYVSPGVQREKILERSVRKYLYWALTDVGLRPKSDANYIPVHALIRRRRGRTTLQTLEDIAKKLQKLTDRHHRARNVQPSIEMSTLSLAGPDHTRIIDDDDTLPTLVGLVIISSVIVVVTLSPFGQPATPSSPRLRQTVSPPNSDPDHEAQQRLASQGTDITDRLRIIAEFDFSQQDQDVWNALGIAIVAMQIRKEALRANANVSFSYENVEMLGSEIGSVAGSRLSVDLESMYEDSSRLEMDDDPDL